MPIQIKRSTSSIIDLPTAKDDDSFADLEWDDLEYLVTREDCPWQVFDRLGGLAAEKGDASLAISWHRRAMEKAGEPIDQNLKLVKLLIDTNRFADAVAVLEPYLERFPENEEVQEWLTVVREARDTLGNDQDVAITAGPLLDYWRWRERRLDDALTETLCRERVEKLWRKRPLFEILLILKPSHESLLADSIDSLAQQAYTGWRLCIFAQGASPEPEFSTEGGPVRWIQCAREEIDERINTRLIESPADWFGIFECGAQWSPGALLMLGDYIAIRPQWALIYADDDCIAANGRLHSPRFKPDLNLEFLRSTDYIGGFFVEKRAMIAAGGFSMEAYDLLLRVIDVSGEAAIGHIPEVLVHFPEFASARASDEGATEALRRHFARREIPVSIQPGLVADETRRVVYLHEDKPKVSIIVPTKNRLDLLGPCIETLLEKTFYPNWELLIVDNDSDDPNVHAYYDRLRELVPDRVRIVPVPGGFDFSAMNNRAAREARGDYLLLLNNDTECIHGEWLDAMMGHAQRADVGLVGARLLFPETLRLQHAGMVLGMGDGTAANHVFCSHPHDVPSYMNRSFVDQEYSAVTGACILIRASIFHEVAGLDPYFKIQHQDVDLCLKVGKLGYRVIWTPFATLFHHGSASLRGSFDAQKHAAVYEEYWIFVDRWRHLLANDPAWNRNLDLNFTKPTVERELMAPWNIDFHERPRLLYLPAASPAAAEYRGGAPLRALNVRGDLHYAVLGCETQRLAAAKLDRLAPDAILMHAPIDDHRLDALLLQEKYNPNIFRIYSIDDLLHELPENHPRDSDLSSDAVMKRIRRGLAASHRLIVNTEALADAYRDMIGDIRVVADALEWRIWGALPARRPPGKRLRVGWAGRPWQEGDLDFLSEVVKATCKDVDWIFFGGVPEEVRHCIAEFHDEHRDFETYPEKLASLGLDLALAPLKLNRFNQAKSNSRLLEYGILGWPTLCTDILPYQTGDPPVARLPNDSRQWIEAILDRVGQPEALEREGDALREWVKAHHLLENRLDSWLSAVSG